MTEKEIKEAFKKKQKAYRAMATAGLFIFAALVFRTEMAQFFNLPIEIIGYTSLGIMIILVIISGIIWRCPACYATFWFGPFTRKDKCHKCGARLE